jgi:hypothetical protein
MKLKKNVSDAVRRKNQENSRKSTGPNTAQGKNNMRFNAVKHGLTARRLMFTDDGKPVRGLSEMVESLRARYNNGDVVTELLIENIVADCWRQNIGLIEEIRCLTQPRVAFDPRYKMPVIQRYNTANRRALLKNLELLEKLHSNQNGSEEPTAPTEDDPSPVTEVDESALQSEDLGEEPALSDDESEDESDDGSEDEDPDRKPETMDEDEATATSPTEEAF